MTKHRWRENTDEGVRHYLATVHGGRWNLLSMLKDDEDWTVHDPIALDDLFAIREMLWRKYQRKRVPWKSLEQIDVLIKKAGGDPPGEPG